MIRKDLKRIDERRRDLRESTSELQNELAASEGHLEDLRTELSQFRVLPEYERHEQEASELTSSLADLADANTMDRLLISQLEASMEEEAPPTDDAFMAVYDELGLTLPDLVAHHLGAVREFHASVVRNRRLYLDGQLEAARQRVSKREEKKAKLDDRRAEVMSILSATGALDQYAALQEELGRERGKAEALRRQLELSQDTETKRAEMVLERDRLMLLLRQDLKEREATVHQAIRDYQEIVDQLVQWPGHLTIEPYSSSRPCGLRVEAHIQGDDSQGITGMEIFAFDMMLMQTLCRRHQGPGFLMHDSHLFDPMDSRQIKTALEYGAGASEKWGFQYIVTFNTDRIPRGLPDDFIDKHALPVRLTDATEDGGLFGFRF